MGVERIGQIAESLVATDGCGHTRRMSLGTTGQQQTIEGTLGTIADVVAANKFTALP